jgi:hypothetical protein
LLLIVLQVEILASSREIQPRGSTGQSEELRLEIIGDHMVAWDLAGELQRASREWQPEWMVFAARNHVANKTKRPRLDLSRGTLADQPSPKCCSKVSIV